MLAGVLLGAAAAVKAPLLLIAAGTPSLYDPWQLLGRAVGLQIANSSIDLAGAFASVILAVIMLQCMPAGPAGYPFARPALALTLAWLIATPQQRPWYDAAIFPLLALMPTTRLDWIVVVRTAAAALAELPGVTYYACLNPGWLAAVAKAISTSMAPLVLIGAGVALLWLRRSERWNAPDLSRTEPVTPAPQLSRCDHDRGGRRPTWPCSAAAVARAVISAR
jgi:hypothetical protein